jgi:hypothetical protein
MHRISQQLQNLELLVYPMRLYDTQDAVKIAYGKKILVTRNTLYVHHTSNITTTTATAIATTTTTTTTTTTMQN